MIIKNVLSGSKPLRIVVRAIGSIGTTAGVAPASGPGAVTVVSGPGAGTPFLAAAPLAAGADELA